MRHPATRSRTIAVHPTDLALNIGTALLMAFSATLVLVAISVAGGGPALPL
jgi:hypothetical protein